MNKERKEPYKILFQNIRRLVTENSKVKIEYFKEYVLENKILAMNFTETWLDKTITKDIKIPGYEVFRCDRKDRKGGGTAIYLNEDLEATVLLEVNIGRCEMIAIYIEKINAINIVVYRPPDTKIIDFNKILKEIKELLSKMNTPEPVVIITGDFNFPFVKWTKGAHNGCRWEMINSGSTLDERAQFLKLIEVFDNYNLVQAIDEPTRERNTLDLIFTNDISIFTNTEITKSGLSDHHQIEVTTNFKTNNRFVNNDTQNYRGESEFWQLNFRNDNVSWDNINKEINEVPWQTLFNSKNTEECTYIFMKCLLNICMKFIPRKNTKGKSRIPRERKKLLNRLKMLKRTKHRTRSKPKVIVLDKKIQETEDMLLCHRKTERKIKENAVIENMKKNPKVLFDYINKQKDRDTKIGPFKIQNEYIYDLKEICKLLVDQYNSQFSINNDRPKINEEIFNNNNIEDGDLNDIELTEKDIIDAIGELNMNSAAGPDGIPAIFLINTKISIANPLKMILRKSLDEEKIPDIFKLAYVTPIHKGGSKLKPEQYRPVSLTSHVMKIFERVIKRNIMKHLTEQNLINSGQHGFVPGRSTQTQLLQHYCDIFETLSEDTRIDTIFLDFAKAFDKVDHDILLQKVFNHKIKGKIGLWLKEFLNSRKYRVVANGEMSEEQSVLSGVPQGTVLAAILFVIMISDIDENVKNSIVRLFADDTRISRKIESEEDKVLLQKDLDIIYDWANKNLMKFNEGKFEQMSHGENKNIKIEPYKTQSGNEIKIGETVKDLGITANSNLLFREHIDNIVTSSKIMSGILLRTFSTRQEAPMMRMFNSYIKSKLEYCSIVWSPWHQNEINKLERIQKNFTSKIHGLDQLDYHERLKKLNLYSLERRRERYLIINAWQQIEGITENILGLKARRIGRSRRIKTTTIPLVTNGKRIKERNRTLIHNSTTRKMERLFNVIPQSLRNITDTTTETFKRHLDKWLESIPDTPKIDGYGASVAAESNSIFHQAQYSMNR